MQWLHFKDPVSLIVKEINFITFDWFRQWVVYDESHIWFVNSHAKGYGRADYAHPVLKPFHLNLQKDLID